MAFKKAQEQEFVPSDASRMECLIVHETLRRMKQAILKGAPSGRVLDQAMKEATELGVRNSVRDFP